MYIHTHTHVSILIKIIGLLILDSLSFADFVYPFITSDFPKYNNVPGVFRGSVKVAKAVYPF